jgi:hypothetical protein
MSQVDGRIAHPTCSVCGVSIESHAHGESGNRCVVCFERYLRAVDAAFLDDYAKLGARKRLVVAETCLRGLVLADLDDRKLLAMAVYEQFIAATTDVIALYHALLDRRGAPIVKGVLGFQLDLPQALAFFADLSEFGPTELLASLGLPHPSQIAGLDSGLDRRERGQVRAALSDAMADLVRLLDFRPVGEQALVGAARRLNGRVALTDQTAWLSGRRLPAGQVAALTLSDNRDSVELSTFSTDEETLGAVVDGIEVMTRLVRNIIFSFVSLHSPKQFHDGFHA